MSPSEGRSFGSTAPWDPIHYRSAVPQPPADAVLVAVTEVVVERESSGVLLERFRSGDEDAWNTIVGRFERLVYSIALRSGLNREDAADVTQSTFAALIRQIDNIKQPDRLGSWLTTVARRLAWRRIETLRRESPIGDDIDVRIDFDDSERFAAEAEVYDAMSRLPAACQDIITRLFLDPKEPTYAELSVVLGRPVGSIGPTRQRCLDRLRAIIEEQR